MTPGATARCARHPDLASTFTCPRCGTFGCVECERRPSVDAPPLCPSCWALTARTAPTGALQTAALVVGVLALIPCCPLTLASLVVNLFAIFKSTPEHRWKPIVGLCVTLFGGLLQLFFVFYQIFSGPPPAR